MKQIQIPCFPISPRTTWGEMFDVIEASVAAYEKHTGTCPPLLIFEPVPSIPGTKPTLSEAPEELIVVAVGQQVREAMFQALKRVEAREPMRPPGPPAKMPKVGENTRLKSFFRQMAEMPATVFSLTFPDDGPDASTIFFLRTAFTISEFRREAQQPIL